MTRWRASLPAGPGLCREADRRLVPNPLHVGLLRAGSRMLQQQPGDTAGEQALHQAPPGSAYAADVLGCGLGTATATDSCQLLQAPITTSFVVPAGMWGTPRQLAIRMRPFSAATVAFGLTLEVAGGVVSEALAGTAALVALSSTSYDASPCCCHPCCCHVLIRMRSCCRMHALPACMHAASQAPAADSCHNACCARRPSDPCTASMRPHAHCSSTGVRTVVLRFAALCRTLHR
jgi:hypothetical protein